MRDCILKDRILAAIFIFYSLLASSNPVFAKGCGDITIADMNWATAQITTAVDAFILSEGFECDVELSSTDVVPALASMRDTGKPDLIPELWINAVLPQIEQAVALETIQLAGEILADGGEQGWWIPSYIADAHPDIRSITDALARPELFPSPNDKSKAALHNCPDGWDCQIATANLFQAYGALEAGFELINERSAAGLNASLATAYENNVGWLGYYWAPTSMLGRYQMVKLDDPVAHDSQQWEACTSVEPCSDPKPNAWPRNPASSVVSRAFAENEVSAMSYVSTRQWKNDMLNMLLAWRADNQANAEEVAQHFFIEHENLWMQWVPSEVTRRIKIALEAELSSSGDDEQ